MASYVQTCFRPCGINKIIKVWLGNTASQPSSDRARRTWYNFTDVTAAVGHEPKDICAFSRYFYIDNMSYNSIPSKTPE